MPLPRTLRRLRLLCTVRHVRPSAIVALLLLTLWAGEAVAVGTCQAHMGTMPAGAAGHGRDVARHGVAHGGARGHGPSHDGAHHAAAPQSGDDGSALGTPMTHTCTCAGDCVASVAALPAVRQHRAPVPAALLRVRIPSVVGLVPTASAPHVLPFANGPPASALA